MYLKLIRQPKGPSTQHPNDPVNAVRGTLYSVQHRWSGSAGVHKEYLTRLAATLENADRLIPALIYRVQVTRSPKFVQLMPELVQVPGRNGIRIHVGTRPEHSEGCILIPSRNAYETLLSTLLDEQNNKQPIYIEIV